MAVIGLGRKSHSNKEVSGFMELVIKNLSKYQADEVWLQDISLKWSSSQFNTLLGRTGAGKTTLLRVVTGLDKPSVGQVFIDGTDITQFSVRQRQMAFVYQQFINYPNFSVFDNIACALQLAQLDKSLIQKKVHEVAEQLQITALLNRFPHELSGGQQQRVAIARALVKEAKVVLLDEPLVNLDYKLRESLRRELKQLFTERNSVVLYATTEPIEALQLGGCTTVLHQGVVLQQGNVETVYTQPDSQQSAKIVSDPPMNFYSGKVHQQVFCLADQKINSPIWPKIADGDYLLGIKANHLSLYPLTSHTIRLQGTLQLSEVSGSETYLHVQQQEHHWVIQAHGVHRYTIGETIVFYLNSEQSYLFDNTGQRVFAPTPHWLEVA